MKRSITAPLFTGLAYGSLLSLLAACGSPPPPESANADTAGPSAAEPSPAEPADDSSHAGLRSDAQREQTVERLIAEYDQAAQHGTKTEPALKFVKRHGAALTQAYVDGHASLSPKARLALINLLVSFDDPLTAPALALAIRNYAETKSGVDEAIWACQAAKKVRSAELGPALLAAFEGVDMSDKDGRRFGPHLEQAMIFNALPAWVPTLRAKLNQPILRPERFDDKPAVREFNNQRFWQLTAARVLGAIEDGDAARDLLRVMWDADKADIQLDATRAFLGSGREAVNLLHAVLSGEEAEFSAQAAKLQPEASEARVILATKLLEELAHPSSREPLLAAWKKSQTPEARVITARALSRLPKSDESVQALKQTFESTRSQTTLPDGEGALESLAAAAVLYFDPTLADWMSERIGSVPGAGARRADVQRALVLGVSELMLEDQVKALSPPAQKFGGRIGTPAFEAAAELLKRCGNKPTCYAEAVTESGSQTDDRAGVAVKAATMVGVFGKSEHRDTLLRNLGEIRHAAVANRVAEVIAHMTPSYDAGVAAALQARLQSEKDPTLAIPFERALQRVQARR
jgi:hypothetical protein